VVRLKNGITMAQIGPSKGTRGEVIVAEFLEANGYEVERNAVFSSLGLYGQPKRCSVDVSVPSLRLAIFIDGRFWHDPAYAAKRQRPHHKVDWVAKATRNQARDKRVTEGMWASGIAVIRLWDDLFKGKARTKETLDGLLATVKRLNNPYIGQEG
jgi:DNA mismatch endonuclease Vsr